MSIFRGNRKWVGLVVLSGCLLLGGPVFGEELQAPDLQAFSQTRWGMPKGLEDGHPNFQSECGFLFRKNGREPSAGQGGTQQGGSEFPGNGPKPGKIFLLHLIQKFGVTVPPCP